MNIKNIKVNELAANGYTGKLPNRGYALRTNDEKLIMYRRFNTSWLKAFKSAINAFSSDKHLELVIYNIC
jgi:hypothetical protein